MTTPYTVLLLYPDYLASQYGEETFLAFVHARGRSKGIKTAQYVAKMSQEFPDEVEAEDFLPLYMTYGHRKDILGNGSKT